DRLHGTAVRRGRPRRDAAPAARVRPRDALQPAQAVPGQQALRRLPGAEAGVGMTTTWRPETLDALRAVVADAHASRTAAPAVDLSSLGRVLAYSPDDLTVTVEAGITVAALQQALAPAGQWLPVDPPHPETTTVADLLQFDVSGPRRFG